MNNWRANVHFDAAIRTIRPLLDAAIFVVSPLALTAECRVCWTDDTQSKKQTRSRDARNFLLNGTYLRPL